MRLTAVQAHRNGSHQARTQLIAHKDSAFLYAISSETHTKQLAQLMQQGCHG
jgi:hypothetical protein